MYSLFLFTCIQEIIGKFARYIRMEQKNEHNVEKMDLHLKIVPFLNF